MAIGDGRPTLGEGSIASWRLVAALQRVGDGIVEILLAIFRLFIALSGFSIVQLEWTHCPPISTAIPTTIPLPCILPAVLVGQLQGAAIVDDDDGSSYAATPSPPKQQPDHQRGVVAAPRRPPIQQDPPVYTSTLPHVMVKPFNCKGGRLPHQKWYVVSIGWEPRIYVESDESKDKVDGYNGKRQRAFKSLEEARFWLNRELNMLGYNDHLVHRQAFNTNVRMRLGTQSIATTIAKSFSVTMESHEGQFGQQFLFVFLVGRLFWGIFFRWDA